VASPVADRWSSWCFAWVNSSAAKSPARCNAASRSSSETSESRAEEVLSTAVAVLWSIAPSRARSVRSSAVSASTLASTRRYPVTTEGRIAAMALMLLGIGLFGAITATITSYLMNADLSP
jgi:hypothetical protein